MFQCDTHYVDGHSMIPLFLLELLTIAVAFFHLNTLARWEAEGLFR